MKKTKLLLIACASIFFASCSNSSGGGGGNTVNYDFPENENSFTLPSDCERITFPDSMAGKKAYLICSNTSNSNINNADIGLKFNQNEVKEQRYVSSEMEIEKKAVYMGDGFYRDEVRFEVPKLNISKKNNSRNAGDSSNYRDLSNIKYFVEIDGSNNFKEKEFSKKIEGTYCRIWYLDNVDNDSLINKLDDDAFEELANTIDSVFVKETQIFGSNYFSYDGMITADSTTKLDVLVYDLLGDAEKDQNSGVLGFFRPYDFYLNETIEYQNTIEKEDYELTSNECEVIHIDSYFLNFDVENDSKSVQSTLFHEFQHLLNFCNKYGNYETWFTEMLAMCAEDIFQSQIGLSDADSPKSRFYETFDKPYKGFGNWPDTNDDNVLYAYANAYAFGAYLMRNYGGVELIHEIATNNYRDESAISIALRTVGKTNEDFNSVFNNFGMVYINPESSKNSLNINISNTYQGTIYNLGAINLKDYYFREYDSEDELKNDLRNLFVDRNDIYTNQERTAYWIKGPCIFRSSYSLREPIQPMGFATYYLGTIESGKSYNVNNQNLTMTVVVKD